MTQEFITEQKINENLLLDSENSASRFEISTTLIQSEVNKSLVVQKILKIARLLYLN